jgi:putative acetyltransferase
MPLLSVSRESPDQPAVRALLQQSDDYMAERYPAESNHTVDVNTLVQPEVAFFVARLDGTAVGCGALVSQDDASAELKRVFVCPQARGQRVAATLMQALETHAQKAGVAVIRLETGTLQPEALSLYQRLGYQVRGPFGSYAPDPFSIFMEKTL